MHHSNSNLQLTLEAVNGSRNIITFLKWIIPFQIFKCLVLVAFMTSFQNSLCHLRCWRMLFTGMWHHEALVRTNISEECITSITQRSVLQLWVTANIVLSLPILSTLMMEVIQCSKMLVLTRGTQQHIPVNDILYSHCCENLKCYILCVVAIKCLLFVCSCQLLVCHIWKFQLQNVRT
jgi:hypothetical protein